MKYNTLKQVILFAIGIILVDLNYFIKILLEDMTRYENQIQKGSNYLANYCGEISGSSKNAAKMIKNVISNTHN